MFLEEQVYIMIASIFGNPLIAGAVIIFWIAIFGIAMGLKGESWLLAIFFGATMLATLYIPMNTLKLVLIPILGVMIGIFLFWRIFGR